MTIISAKFADFAHSCVVLETIEAGAVFVVLQTNEDMSGGWLQVYAEWSKTNPTAPYEEPQL